MVANKAVYVYSLKARDIKAEMKNKKEVIRDLFSNFFENC